jgi:hypothetical protein
MLFWIIQPSTLSFGAPAPYSDLFGFILDYFIVSNYPFISRLP